MYPPRVNLNGTSGKELVEQYREATRAITAAFKALQQCAPHGRDFQTVAPEEYRLARQQHNRWLTQLDDIRKQVETTGVEIVNQL